MILDDTLIDIHRCTTGPDGCQGENQDPCYSGKYHRPVVIDQALRGTDGGSAFVGEARCRSTHDLTGAREDGIIDAVAESDIET